MPIFVADIVLPDVTHEQLVATQKEAIEMSRRFTAEGRSVRYVRSIVIPSESHCICLFEAENAKIVQEVNEAAQIPFTRIVEAMELTPNQIRFV